ncbi:hypothetical protein VB776_04495 [Arcicella sp. DC2W]|uniref:DNA-binding protein n=1 Tax=Arcicella gelida TaxID=2984195 RepID=A0ABU5S104_9BACT|nr:hypothetical protein [Arcicella sp. DC2W]MEA5402157.1 hypothetical protein [Arcicella sp. DC2W]
MENFIYSKTPLFVTIEEVMVIMECKKTFAYKTIQSIKEENPSLKTKGSRIPTKLLAEHIGLTVEEIGDILSEHNGTNISPPFPLIPLDS